MELGSDFKLGVATSALQIEGGDSNNNWYRWSELGKIKDGSHSFRANDHFNRYREDIELMQGLNLDTYRMGIEWSRIEPARGEFCSRGMEHYRREIKALQKAGIEPLLTLYHFSHPLWFEEMGGWSNPEAVDIFLRFVAFCVQELGDLVAEWVTINEPNVYAYFSYLQGEWPPGEKNLLKALQCMRNMIIAHVRSYETIHRLRKERNFPGETRVGAANHIRIFDGADFPGKISARILNYFFNELSTRGMAEGILLFPLGRRQRISRERRIFQDFFGLNYYTRDVVRLDLKKAGHFFGRIENDPELDKNDLGWDIYPQGLSRICREYFSRYRIPIYITENGICDAADNLRPRFIYDHLREVHKLRQGDIPVERYYYWTLMDNFEWVEGEEARFGLVHCDFPTQKRSLRPSARFYAAICRSKKVSSPMRDEFISPSSEGVKGKN